MAYEDVVKHDAPVAYYRLEEESGADAADSSGNGYDGTYVGGPTLGEPGLVGEGNAVRLLSGDEVELNNGVAVHDTKPSPPFTIEFWTTLPDLSGSGGLHLFRNDGGAGSNYHGFWIQYSHGTGLLAMHYGDGGGASSSSRRTAFGDSTIVDDTPYHVVAIVRGPTDMDLWLNGVKETLSYDGSGDAIAFSTAEGTIGRAANSDAVLIDEVAVYDFELVADRITHHYEVGSGTANNAPNQPTVDLVHGTTSAITARSSAFSDPDTGDVHRASQWQIDVHGGDFSSPLEDSGEDLVNLLEYQFTGLSEFTRYNVRVRHQDLYGNWSAWSAAVDAVTAWTTLAADPFTGGALKYVEVVDADTVMAVRHFESDDDLENVSSEDQTLSKVLGIGGGGGAESTTGTEKVTGGGGAGAVDEWEDIPVNAGEIVPVRPGAAGTTGKGESSVLWVSSGAALDPGTDPEPTTAVEGGGRGLRQNGGDGGSGGGGGSGSGGGTPATTSGGSANDPLLGNDGGGGASSSCSGFCCRRNGGGGGGYGGAGTSGGGVGSTTPGQGGAAGALAEFGVLAGGGGDGGALQSDSSGSCSSSTFELAGTAGNGVGAGAGGNAGNSVAGGASGGGIYVRYEVEASPATPGAGGGATSLSDLKRFYFGIGSQIAYLSTSNADLASKISALVRTRPIAPAGVSGEALFTNLYLSVVRGAATTVEVTPIVDGELITAEKVTLALSAPPRIPTREDIEIGLGRDSGSNRTGLRGTWFSALIVLTSEVSGARVECDGADLQCEIVTEGVDDRSFTEESLQLRSAGDVTPWYFGAGNEILLGGSGVDDDGTVVRALAETNWLAPAGIGGEAIFTNVYLTLQYDIDAALTLHVTPILDGVEQDVQVVTLDATTTPVREEREIGLSIPYPNAVSPEFMYAMRGTWFAVRIETSGALPAGRVVFEGVEVDQEVVTEGEEAVNAG